MTEWRLWDPMQSNHWPILLRHSSPRCGVVAFTPALKQDNMTNVFFDSLSRPRWQSWHSLPLPLDFSVDLKYKFSLRYQRQKVCPRQKVPWPSFQTNLEVLQWRDRSLWANQSRACCYVNAAPLLQLNWPLITRVKTHSLTVPRPKWK